jgi:hypothetical protein
MDYNRTRTRCNIPYYYAFMVDTHNLYKTIIQRTIRALVVGLAENVTSPR